MIRESLRCGSETALLIHHTLSTGYGHHGDYVFGWEEGALQKAMDNCFDILGLPESCSVLQQQPDADMNKCLQETRINERVENTCKYYISFSILDANLIALSRAVGSSRMQSRSEWTSRGNDGSQLPSPFDHWYWRSCRHSTSCDHDSWTYCHPTSCHSTCWSPANSLWPMWRVS